jgi:hypothetical protein
MKKLMLVAAVLLGGIAASKAGVDVHIGIGLPFPRPERVIISRPAPVIVAPAPVCAPAPVVVAPPVCHAPAPVVVVPRYDHYRRYSYNDHRRGWDNHRGYDYRGSSHHSYRR